LQQTAALLDRRLALLWQGPRTAPARQKTLQATLDWSYGLLSELERAVLRRLAVFVGHFTVDAALAVVADSTVDEAAVFAAIDSLVAKSMLATHPIGAMMRYRLLDTTRAYAVEIADEAERNDLAVRHATYCRGWLEQTGAEWPTFSNAAQREPHLAALNNVRAALDWCFGPNGTVDVGIGLAAAAAPVFLAMSLLAECHRWSERAVLAMNDTNRGGPQEMHLQAALGVALMFTRGNSEAARDALTRSLAIAEDQGDAASELQLLNLLHMFHHRIGDFKATLRYAKRSAHSSKIVGVPAGLALAHCLLGSSLHHLGDLAGARLELEAALERGSGVQRVSTIYLDFEHYNYADIALARTLWLQGHPAQALERAHRSVRDAAAMDQPVPLSRALVWAICVFHWAGDVANADEYTNKLIAHAELHALEPYLAVGRGYKAVFDVCRSDAHTGIACLQNSLEILHAARYELLTTAFQLSLVRGFATIGAFGEGMTLIDEVIRRVETQGEALYAPELLRVKGTLLQSMPEPRIDEAEAQFTRSLALSRRQGARGWELRAAINLAALHARQGRPDSGRAVLHPVFAQFTEGLDTGDLKAAEHLLTTLVRPISKQF
jgi:predicted ATPase